MAPSTNAEFKRFIEDMIRTKEAYLERLLKLDLSGVRIGAPTIEDIITRETEAIENLKTTLARLQS